MRIYVFLSMALQQTKYNDDDNYLNELLITLK